MKNPMVILLAVLAFGGILLGWITIGPVEEIASVEQVASEVAEEAEASARATEEVVENQPAPDQSELQELLEKTAPVVSPMGDREPLALQPHRAIYGITLKTASDRSGISAISGDMSFVFHDRCDGWTAENNSLLNIQYAQGSGVSHRQSFVTWESKAGDAYRFRVKRFMNDRITDDIQGRSGPADGEETRAVFAKPESAMVDLPKDVRYPSGYLSDLIVAARRGDKILSRHVFEGDEVEPAYLVNAVISPTKGKPSAIIQETSGLGEDVEAWAFRLAYFRVESNSPEPEFELRLIYRADGIADQIVQDFGDYSLAFELKELEVLTDEGC